MIDYEAIIDSVDVIVSIGGDIYTIPQVARERHKYSYYNPLVDFCERAIRKGKEVIVYGASVGPWGKYKKAIDYNIQALSKYKMIFCREETSIPGVATNLFLLGSLRVVKQPFLLADSILQSDFVHSL